MSESPFALAAPTLIGMGYSPMPVAPRCDPLFEGHRPPTGKEPGRLELRTNGEELWVRLKAWTVFCKRQAHPLTIAHWSRMPDTGVCVACGFGNLIAIDVDHPDLIEPIRAILTPILVEKVGRKGFTAFYRTAEPMPSTNYDDANGHRLIDFLSDGKQSVIPGTIHPDTGLPYEWRTPATLLNTTLKALPAFTQAHREAMEEVLRAHGWDAPKPTVARSKAIVERPVRAASEPRRDDDVNAAALANLSAWVPVLGLPKTRPNGAGYRAVAPWRGSGSGRSEAKRGTNLSFHPTGITDFGSGDGFRPVGIVAKARSVSYSEAAAWLRDQLGLTDAPAPTPPVQATYPDHRVPLDEAEQKLREAIAGFETTMREWRDRRATSLVFEPPINVIKIGTGGGKTHEAAAKITVWLPRGWRIAVAVPNHKLARQVARTIRAHGLNVETYRGYTQPDPRASAHQMCRNIPAYEAASDLGVSIRSAVCEQGETTRCAFIETCGCWRQQKLTPDVWVVTHATLLFERPDFIAELDGPVTDEQFFNGGIGKQAEDEDDERKLGKSQKTNVAALRKRKIEACSDEEQDFITHLRHRLFDAVRSNGDGDLTRQALIDAEISAEDASTAALLEQRRITSKVLSPNMPADKIDAAISHHKTPNKRARAAGSMWDEIANFLALDNATSGRLKVGLARI